MFGALKVSIKSAFSSMPKTVQVIIHLGEFADTRLTEGYIFHTGKSLRIHSNNEGIKILNEKASLSLNDKGCRLYNAALNKLEDLRDKLLVTEVGVDQTVRGQEIQYTTTCDSCSCSKFSSFQVPCIHILLRREHQNRTDSEFPLYCQQIFHQRYHRNSEGLINILAAQLDDEVVDMQEEWTGEAQLMT